MQRVQLGVFPATTLSVARDHASGVQSKIYAGVDVVAERRWRRTCPTLNEAFAFYLEHHAKQRKRTWEADQAQYNRYIKARWGGRRLNTIRKPDVAKIHADVGRDHGVYAANRLRSLLAKVFTVAIHPVVIRQVQDFLDFTEEQYQDVLRGDSEAKEDFQSQAVYDLAERVKSAVETIIEAEAKREVASYSSKWYTPAELRRIFDISQDTLLRG